MIILTEKPSVAKSFSDVFNCTEEHFVSGKVRLKYYANKDKDITVINCVGHLFRLYEPAEYDVKFKDWKTLPVIPEHYRYKVKESVSAQANFVISVLKKNKDKQILIATDADREGEIIARECLLIAGIKDFSKITRFWVSQALTNDVINKGIDVSQNLRNYNNLANQGFARQHSDWLTGINCSRYISVAAGQKLPVGRVQTAILSAIDTRNKNIENFVSKKYFEYYGIFDSSGKKFKGLYFENDNYEFFNELDFDTLSDLKNSKAIVIQKTEEDKNSYPPQLYNLTALQKDVYKMFGYSADKTLEIVQSLYEELKCVSYPRSPSRVMGSSNIELCYEIYKILIENESDDFQNLQHDAKIFLTNKRCFNDAELEAHHAIIPLSLIPNNATEEQKNVYSVIKKRFLLAFLPEEKYRKTTRIIEVKDKKFKVSGKTVLDEGWKKYSGLFDLENDESDQYQDLQNIDWNNTILSEIEKLEKWTKAPKYFNEGSILAFMENPYEEENNQDEKNNSKKLIGLGTEATRSSYIPKLISNGYLIIDKKNLIVTQKGKVLIEALRNSSLSPLTDIPLTTQWEQQLKDNPQLFEKLQLEFVNKAVSQNINIDKEKLNIVSEKLLCPLCKKTLLKNKLAWYCTGHNDGCNFPSLWINTAGTTFTQNDIENLVNGKKTTAKKCKTKQGKIYKARFYLDNDNTLQREFVK